MSSRDRERIHVAVVIDALRKELEARDISSDCPIPDQETDCWGELVSFCRKVMRDSGMTAEETEEIVRAVRKRVYGRSR